MKQLKFFLVALMSVMMGVSVTSCMKGDENTQVDGRSIIGKVKDNFMGLTFTSLDGYTVKSKNVVDGTSNYYTGDYIIASCSYDTEIDVEYATKTINATVGSTEKISGNEVIGTTKTGDSGADAVNKSNRAVRSISDYAPMMVDKNNLLITIQYFAHEKIDKHAFKLVYYTDESEMKGKTDLKLYLRHTSTEEQSKETLIAFSYRVFDLSSALHAFKNANDQKNPTNIIIESELNLTNTEVPLKTTPVSITYTHKD